MQLTPPSSANTLQIPPPRHSISCRYFECVYWVTLRLRYAAAAATVSIIVGGVAPHHRPHPAMPPSTSVAIFMTLRFSNLVPYVAILKTFRVKTNKFWFTANGMQTIRRQCSTRSQFHPHVHTFDQQTIHGQFANCLVRMCVPRFMFREHLQSSKFCRFSDKHKGNLRRYLDDNFYRSLIFASFTRC